MTYANKIALWLLMSLIIMTSSAFAATMCQTAGQADHFVLALSWQQNFCKNRTKKPECQNRDPEFFNRGAFSLHGLWPNKKSCGTKYGFCGEITQKPKNFCQYPALELPPNVRQQLNNLMPSAKAGSCLQRHEWFKHGTCGQNWTAERYFSDALDLTQQFNHPRLMAYMRQHRGKSVTKTEMQQLFATLWGPSAVSRIQLKCRKNSLSDIYIHLPRYGTTPPKLRQLLSTNIPPMKETCSRKFRIES